MKPQKITDKPQQESVTTLCEKQADFFFYKKSSIFPLDPSEKLFLATNQHQSLDSICSKTKLPNSPKSECKLWKFTTVQVGIMGEGFSAMKKYGSKTTNHS